MLTHRQGVWRVSVNRDSLWNMERNDHFPTKTLNRFYAWTKGPKQRHHNTSSQNSRIWTTKWIASLDSCYTGVLSLNLGTLHFLSLKLIHVQYSDTMRFMVLHNRHHKVSQSVPFFMHHKTVTILSRIRVRVRGHFVTSNTKYHESHYFTPLKPPFSIWPADYFKYYIFTSNWSFAGTMTSWLIS